jgi:hypothetical protein
MMDFLIFLIYGLVVFAGFTFASWMVGGDPFFYLRKKVYLLNHLDEILRTREYKTKSGERYFYVYAHSKVGGPNLMNDDGTIRGPSCYINRWSYDRDELLIMSIK